MRLLLSFLFLTALCLAGNSTISDGNNAYKSGNFQLAIEKYDSVLASGFCSSELYYNTGNAYFKQGRLGYAVLNYERALSLSPSDEDVLFNLKITRARLKDNISPTPQFFLYTWLNSLVLFLSADGWTYLLMISLFVFAILVYLFIYASSTKLRKLFLIGTVSVLLIVISSIVLITFRYKSDTKKDWAVITNLIVQAKFAPSNSEKDVFVIHEGLKVKIDEVESDWYKIRLSDGKVGWVAKNCLVII